MESGIELAPDALQVCTPVHPLHPCTLHPAPLEPPAPLHLCTSAPLHLCTSAPLHPCTPHPAPLRPTRLAPQFLDFAASLMHSARALPLPGRVVLGTTACSLRAAHRDWWGSASSLLPGALLRRQGRRYSRTAAGVKRDTR